MIELLLDYSLGLLLSQQAAQDTYCIPRSINLPRLLVTLVPQTSYYLIQLLLLLTLELLIGIRLPQMLFNLRLEVRKNLQS